MPQGQTYQKAVELIASSNEKVIILKGPAGTGKTDAAIGGALEGLARAEKDPEKSYKQLVVFRNPLEVGEKLGLLPGDLREKQDPWFHAVADICARYNRAMPYIDDRDPWLICETISHCKGKTYADSYIIIEEGQDINYRTLKTLLKRIGKNSVLIVTGDDEQSENSRLQEGFNRLVYAIEKYGDKDFEVVDFANAKNYRSRICKKVCNIFDKLDKEEEFALNQVERYINVLERNGSEQALERLDAICDDYLGVVDDLEE